MMPAEHAPVETKALSVPETERKRRIEVIRKHRTFMARVGEALSQRFAGQEPSQHLEKRIYDGFTSWADQNLLEEFHEEPWENRIGLIERIQDSRLVEYANRLVYFERPDLLSDRASQEMSNWLAYRILTDDEPVPWMSISKALLNLESELESADQDETEFLERIREFLVDRPNHLGVG